MIYITFVGIYTWAWFPRISRRNVEITITISIIITLIILYHIKEYLRIIDLRP